MQPFNQIEPGIREYTEPETKMVEGKAGKAAFLNACMKAFERGERVAIRCGSGRSILTSREKDCGTIEEVRIFINSHQNRHDARPEIVPS